MTQYVLDAFDAAIRADPGQWFWYNKRWILDPVIPAAGRVARRDALPNPKENMRMNARSLVIAGALALLFRPSVAAPPPVEDLHIPPAAPGAHYYVDIEHAAADDDNPGTPEAPFRTLHGALQALQGAQGRPLTYELAPIPDD